MAARSNLDNRHDRSQLPKELESWFALMSNDDGSFIYLCCATSKPIVYQVAIGFHWSASCDWHWSEVSTCWLCLIYATSHDYESWWLWRSKGHPATIQLEVNWFNLVCFALWATINANGCELHNITQHKNIDCARLRRRRLYRGIWWLQFSRRRYVIFNWEFCLEFNLASI